MIPLFLYPLFIIGSIVLGIYFAIYGKKDEKIKGKIPDNCIGIGNSGMMCPSVFDPVIGCDNRLYSNFCEASSAGITSTTPLGDRDGSKFERG